MSGVLRACESPGPNLVRWLQDEGHPGHLALRSALRQSTDPATRARCVRWLTLGALAPAALERLQRGGSETEFGHALPLGYLLLNPARSAKVARASKGVELLPDAAPGASTRLSVAARRELPRWICAAPITPAHRLARLAALLVDGDSAVRLASVRRVATLTRSSPEGVDALVDFTYDAAEQVATAACVELAAGPAHVRACAPTLRAWARLRRSPHAGVRRIAHRESALIDPLASLCSGASDPGVVGAALRLRARSDRAGVVSALRRAIREGEPAGRVRAVLAARRAELTGDCELELLACAADAGEPTVAATAVAALVDVRSSAARSLLERCLGHPDARVRANAIEAVGRQRPDHARIVEAVRDASARARANAVRLVLLADESAPGDALLAAMLSDDRIEHRVAGLWAAERLGRTSLAERVALMARSATSERERAWAHRCGRRLLGGMRVAWASTPSRDDQSEQRT